MMRLCILLAVLTTCVGCASPDDRAQWEEFKKDLRGDNMQMRGNFPSFGGMDDSSMHTGIRN